MINIYIIKNLVNNKVYIGQTKRTIHVRFLEHSRDTGSALYNDMCRYGRSSFTYELLHTCKDEYATQWEHYFICKYDATNPTFGYNKIAGGCFKWVKGGANPSKTFEGRKRISINNRNNIDRITIGFRCYNNYRKFPVGMIDESGHIIMRFESLLAACNYLNKSACGTTRIKQVCDKFNKNGKRAKFFGYSWTALNKGVQTTTNNVGKTEDELPFE